MLSQLASGNSPSQKAPSPRGAQEPSLGAKENVRLSLNSYFCITAVKFLISVYV